MSNMLLVLTGTLPELWGADGSLGNLQQLGFSGANLSGSFPSTWGPQG